VTPRSGQSWLDAISEFEAATDRVMPVRRCYDGAPTTDIATSAARWDLGVRRSVLSIKPTMSTPTTTLESLAASIVAAGHDCDAIVYHEPVDNMSGADFIALYQRTAAPLRAAGVSTGVCFTNWSCNLPYSDPQSALAHYWPGDGVVDFLAIDEYPIGEIPAAGSTSTKDAVPMDVRTRRVCQYADARGIRLNLAEYGVDSAWDPAKSEKWLRSVTDWAKARAAAGTPLDWACYFSINTTGQFSYAVSNRAEFIDAYTDSYRILDGGA